MRSGGCLAADVESFRRLGPASLDLENHVWSVEHNPESIEHVTTEQDVRLFRTGHDFEHSEVVLTSRGGAMEF
jgi:hypothetical protein